MHLVTRDEQCVQTIAVDLKVRAASEVTTNCTDLNETVKREQFLNAAHDALGGVCVASIAHGTLSNQKRCELNVKGTLAETQTNGHSTTSIVTHIAKRLPGKKNRFICVKSSVARDRGQTNNYVYESAKAMIKLSRLA